MHAGTPDSLTVGQGDAYISREMRENLEDSEVMLSEEPIKPPSAIGDVKQYHDPLRETYEKVRKEKKREHTDAECLRMAVGPEGLCPMLLVLEPLNGQRATHHLQRK